MKFKVGEKVRLHCGCRNKEYITNGEGTIVSDDNEQATYPYLVKGEGANAFWHEEGCVHKLSLTLENMPEGTVLVSRYGNNRKVLGVLGTGLYAMSFFGKYDKADCIYTVKELENYGYKIKDQEEEEVEVEELTMEEVCEQLGKTVKIKKD